MQVAAYARVSTPNQQQESTIASQVQVLHRYIHQQGWSLLPEHDYRDEGISGARLDRPALDRLRDAAQRGEFDAVVLLSPDRLARNHAHPWLLIEEFEKLHIQPVFLHNPFGNTPRGKLLTRMQGIIVEYECAQILERTRRGRLEKARRGEFIPWAHLCYGYRYLPKRRGSPPQVMVELAEAEVVQSMYRALVEDHLSCRQIAKRLNASHTPTPSGQSRVWHPATGGSILTNRVDAGQARYNYRQPALPRYRKMETAQRQELKTGRSYHPETDWVWSDAPAIASDLGPRQTTQSRRPDCAASPAVPAPAGNYAVTFKFAEIYWSSAGQRAFNVSMKGKTVLSNLDLVAEVRPKTAYDVKIPVALTDDVLNMTFTAVVGDAQVNGMVVTVKSVALG